MHAISFIRGHYGKVANKAPPGSCNGASAQAAIHLPHQNNPPGLFYPAGIRLFQPTSTCLVMATGYCLAVLIFHKPQDCPAYFKGGV